MKLYGAKNVRLENADMHLHYANNAGRGGDNVTITIVTPGTKRPEYTRGYSDVIYQTRVSGWRGHVNIPKHILTKYGPIVKQGA